MVVREVSEDGKFLVTKSDSGFLVKKINPDNPEQEEVYAEAWDVYPTHYEYEETDIKADDDGEAVESDYIDALKDLGVEIDEKE